MACQHYNSLWADRGDLDKRASPDDDDDFIYRIVLNFLRHACTLYEEAPNRTNWQSWCGQSSESIA